MPAIMLPVLLFTFAITFIGTLGYAVRIVGVRTGRIALSFALFNVLVLVSRTAATLQAPLLGNLVETGQPAAVLDIFRAVLLAAGIATIAGTLAIPTFQRMFTRAVEWFAVNRSVPRLLFHACSPAGMHRIGECVHLPAMGAVTRLDFRRVPRGLLLGNAAAVALLTVSVLAPLYAGSIVPELRLTCGTLSGIMNGFATLLLVLLIDPHLSIMTEDVLDGRVAQGDFRACIVALAGSKIVGAFAALLLLVPAARVVALAAGVISRVFGG